MQTSCQRRSAHPAPTARPEIAPRGPIQSARARLPSIPLAAHFVINSLSCLVVYGFSIFATVRGPIRLRPRLGYRIWADCFPASRFLVSEDLRLFGVRWCEGSPENGRQSLFVLFAGSRFRAFGALRSELPHQPCGAFFKFLGRGHVDVPTGLASPRRSFRSRSQFFGYVCRYESRLRTGEFSSGSRIVPQFGFRFQATQHLRTFIIALQSRRNKAYRMKGKFGMTRARNPPGWGMTS